MAASPSSPPGSHAVIPAPVRFDAVGEREFVFRPGTTVAYADTGVASVVERFCSEITRRTGLRLAPVAGCPAPDEPSVMIELAAGGELGALPAPAGVSPAGDGPADERHSLAIDGDQVILRAGAPAGVARGLTTLIQMLAAVPSAGWTGHRDRLARHGRLWAQDNLTYFRTSTVDWLL